MRIDFAFEAGRIEVVSAEDPSDVRLRVAPDPGDGRFRQWFAFAVEGAEGACRLVLENAGECTWARGFRGYRACARASDEGSGGDGDGDGDDAGWRRVPTTYDGQALRIELSADLARRRPRVAYYPPFAAARVDRLIERAVAGGATRIDVATSLDGAPLACLRFGSAGAGAQAIWVVAQQHPGEHMAGFCAEGLVLRLLERDPAVQELLERATVHVVPRMNPDGCARAHHRTNAAGLDLNRQWKEPAAQAPEIAGVRQAMLARGVDFFLDVHGEEVLRYVFAQRGLGRRGRRRTRERDRFTAALLARCPAFQIEHGYPQDPSAAPNLAIAANWVADRFGCLAFTLEMPFADAANAPDEAEGWSPARCRGLGAALCDALRAQVAPRGAE